MHFAKDTQQTQLYSPLSYFIVFKCHFIVFKLLQCFLKKSVSRFQVDWFKPKDHRHLHTFSRRCRPLCGPSNLLHTTVEARCWRRHSEASWERRTREQTKTRCNLPDCTVQIYCSLLRQLGPGFCFACQLGQQKWYRGLEHSPNSCSVLYLSYNTIPFPSGVRT